MTPAELLRHVLGHQFEEGVVTKIADDLYTGGNTQKISSEPAESLTSPL